VVDVREGGEEGPGEAVEAFNVGLRLACDMDDEGRGEQLPHLSEVAIPLLHEFEEAARRRLVFLRGHCHRFPAHRRYP
jgi:hypothetical protein